MTTTSFALGALIQWAAIALALAVASAGAVALLRALLLGARRAGNPPLARAAGWLSRCPREFSFAACLALTLAVAYWPLQLNALHILMPLPSDRAWAEDAHAIWGSTMVGLPAGLLAWWLFEWLSSRLEVLGGKKGGGTP